jgi:hypothetical protein
VNALLRFGYLLALGLWIGEVAFFSFVAAPGIFGVLGAGRAGDVVAVIFPRYYAIGMAAAGTSVATGILLGRRAAAPGLWTTAVAVLAVGLAATVVAGAVVHPRAQRMRAAIHAAGGQPGEDPAFRRTHGAAMVLNATALVAGIVGLGVSAAALRH